MAMTPVEIERMTLGDLESMAARMESAAKTIRDAMALLHGGAAPAAVVTATAPQPAHTAGPADLSPAEKAERARLLSRIRGEGLPDDIKQMEAS